MECQRFMERVGIAKYLHRVMDEGVDVTHPKSTLERLTGLDKVQYDVDYDENIHGAYRCILSINETRIVEVWGCLTKDESIVLAADATIIILS